MACVSALDSVVLVLGFSEVVVQVVERHLHEALLKALRCGFLFARFGGSSEPRIAVRFRLWTRRSCPEFVVLTFEECPFAQRYFSCVRALIAVWEPLSVNTSPGG